MTCGTCKWWINSWHATPETPDYGGREAQCRRHAPAFKPLLTTNHSEVSAWPTTRAKDGCGDWEARPQ